MKIHMQLDTAFTPSTLDLATLPAVNLDARQHLPVQAACYFVLGHDGTVVMIPLMPQGVEHSLVLKGHRWW
jgi:hypothetical protein